MDLLISPRLRQWARAALDVPLFWKILVANAGVVMATVLLGGVLHDRLLEAHHSAPWAFLALAVAGMGLSLLVNAVILKLALEPLELLERTAARVYGGDLDARAPRSPLADPGLQRLTRTFNAALDALAASRRRVRLLLARAMEADEEERRRVARALEDEAAQQLAGVLVRLRLLERHPDCQALIDLVETAGVEIARALEVVRGYAGERRPAVLGELGLVPALEADARRLMELGALMVRFEGVGPKGLASDLELAMYRVLREALENAARHAEARVVRVRFSNGGGSIVATVEDDGRGFDPESAEEGPGLGLAAMRERTESAGGRLAIWSVPGRGSRVRVEIPVGEPAPVPAS
jgi:two-component system sensor histidine kinase UhpB